MGAIIYKACAWRNDDDSISLRYTYSDNSPDRDTAVWRTKPGATPQDVIDTFSSDTSKGLERVIAALKDL